MSFSYVHVKSFSSLVQSTSHWRYSCRNGCKQSTWLVTYAVCVLIVLIRAHQLQHWMQECFMRLLSLIRFVQIKAMLFV